MREAAVNEPVVSIIIPCYNSFKDMSRCLNSLENQSYKNFEVIVIDDCSNDDSKEKLLKYAQSTSLNIHILSNEINKGPGYSRNVGIQHAKGEWISFCDADDWYANDRLKKMTDASENADCVLCNYSKVYLNRGEEVIDYISRIENKESHNEVIAGALMSFWVCMIKKEIALEIPVADLYNGEDYATMPLWLQASKKIGFVKDSLYYYYMRDNSLSRKPSPEAYINFNKAFKYMSSHSLPEYRQSIEFLGIHHILYGGVLVAVKAGIKKKEIKKYIADFVQQYPDWKNNRYIATLSRSKQLFLKFVEKKQFLFIRMLTVVHSLLLKIR